MRVNCGSLFSWRQEDFDDKLAIFQSLMRNIFRQLYRFLPVQLLLLHFRKYELMLLFWMILLLTLAGKFATHFGASTLFLAPEYLGQINFMSMFLLGGATAIFFMSWNITTFIIHSQRIPFLGAVKQAFLKYCINNSILPLFYLAFYTTVCVRYQWLNEGASVKQIILLQVGFYLGIILILLISFLYFFRVDRNLFKIVVSTITNPSLIREIVPYDSLDIENDIIKADTYLSENLSIQRISDLKSYHPRLMGIVLRRHHRNAIFATFFSLLILLLLGIFMNQPYLRIPAGAGFLLLFSIIMGWVGAVKYFLKTWELVGWIVIGIGLSFLVKFSIIKLGGIAYGMNYEKKEKPTYSYKSLRKKFTPLLYEKDKNYEQLRLNKWLNKLTTKNKKHTLVLLTVSGGGNRSAYWSFRSLQYIDSITHGKLFDQTVLLTGASGGMIGASYWHGLHTEAVKGKLTQLYAPSYQQNIGKDLLNAIIFSFASLDFISPFNKISIGDHAYNRDRGYAMEQELIQNTNGILDKNIGDDKELIAKGLVPQLIINGSIVNDGRKLMISSQPISYLMQPAISLKDSFNPPIDALDFSQFFALQNPEKLRLTTALRMNATFPYVLPVVKLPSEPQIDIMDAGLRDNFGMELIARYLTVHHEWMEQNIDNVIVLQIRDTRAYSVFPFSEQTSLLSSLTKPLFVIQNEWEPFQSYTQTYIKDLIPALSEKVHFVTLTYIPFEQDKSASLNFHITQREKEDLYKSIYNVENQAQINYFLSLIQ